MDFKNRVVSTTEEPTDSILFNPANWRIHPARQQDAVKEALLKVGWVTPVIVNLRTSELWPAGDRNVKTLVDGHMRVTLAARQNEPTVPVTYVDLTPEEEDYVLATLDPLGALAATDKDKMLELVAKQNEQTGAILAAMRGAGLDGRKTFAHIDEGVQNVSQNPNEMHTYQGNPERQAISSRPQDREKYPLAIVLDRASYEKWQIWKKSQGLTRDTEALSSLLDKVIAEVNLD
jgi:hypothetical protein